MRNATILWAVAGLVFILALQVRANGELQVFETQAEFMPPVAAGETQDEGAGVQELLEECARQPFESTVVVELTAEEWASLENGECTSCQEQAQRLQIGINKPVLAQLELRAEQGKPIPAAGRPASQGYLSRMADGRLSWTMKIESAGAGGLRLHFEDFDLKPAISLYWFSEAGEVFGPYTERGPLKGDFWSHTLQGNTGYVAVVMGDGAVEEALLKSSFKLIEIAVMRSDLGQLLAQKELFSSPDALLSCIMDGSCFDTGDFSNIDLLRSSVAYLLFAKGGLTYGCSGGLVNDQDPSTWIPYLLTANHCFSTQDSASSLECVWDFRTSSCNNGFTDGASTSGFARTLGATLLATGASSDFTFVRLEENVPGGRWFLGWTTAEPTNGQTLYRISHPMRAQQSYSTQSVTANPAGDCIGAPLSSFLYSSRVIGGTDGGSSGSPAVNANAQILGQLLGRCPSSGCGPCDSGCFDARVDGRFSLTFDHLRQWLMPPCPTPPQYTFTISPSSTWQTTQAVALDANACHVYRMYLEVSRNYDFSVCDNDSVGGLWVGSGDGDFRMFDSAGTSLYYIDGSSSCGYKASTLGTAYQQWSPPSSGYYYLKVSDYYSDRAAAYMLAYRGIPNSSPNTPTLINPSNDATGLSLTPTLQASSFSDPDGDSHANSQWQVDNNSGFTSPEWDSGDTYQASTQATVPSGRLSYSATYYWRVRYKDNRGAWSGWSSSRYFTTQSAPNNPPNAPTPISPANGATGLNVTPTLQASAFSDPDGNAHANSQWQVDDNTNFLGPVWDSGVNYLASTQATVPTELLTARQTSYCWRVRYKDDAGAWSDWSSASCFATGIQADLDDDGDIDQEDYGRLQSCLSGFVVPEPDCTFALLDSDHYVNQQDVNLFLACMSGADVPAASQCLAAHPMPIPGDMVLIPAGEFQLGDTFNEGSSNALPVHAVYLDAFYMDRYEVTNQQYADALNWAKNQGGHITVTSGVVYKYNTGTSYPYCDTTTSSSYSRITWNGSTFGVTSGKENHPLVMVSWSGSVAYANWRSAMEGKPLGYDLSTWNCNFNSGYRLPTEAEWEKAARGGASGHRFPWSDSDTIQHARANYYSLSGYGLFYDTSPTRGYHPTFAVGGYPYTSPVGYFAPNGYGLYDMAGNVWEWCNDWYLNTYYSSSPYNNPHGPGSGTSRVLRGGSWFNHAHYCRVAFRNDYWPYYRNVNSGFRCAAGTP